ncbi:hypothetical protein NQ315_012132 [Exocentrus adspersus]|uniref:Major facilitator superfamily (MFS) profile domain-containing protein n=1 Tax=Exocentrus adspersus TaxID=1586481 RepID=A0AAV8VZ29_9CUCU|nr:hypothetical protein NQ315_012132 [Exocentrus adspersus]
MVEDVHECFDQIIVSGKTHEPTKVTKKSDGSQAADFETAISATGFGKFNIILILAILPTAFAQVFESTSMSYVLPIAQCDLSLSLEDKGMLNAITFAGMISSGFIWGYICDVTGRKRVMIFGYLLDGFFMLMASSSQNFTMLLVAKFFGGFIINGPFSAATSYLTEFHCSKYRARVHLVRGTIVSLANITLPLIAWIVLPQNVNFTLFDQFDFHSWNVFLLICSLAPLTSGVIFLFMPESPKFLMSAGRNEEALRVFQKIYKINKGKPANTYPIKVLVDENVLSKVTPNKDSVEKKMTKNIVSGLYTIKPLFCRPHVLRIVHVCMNTFIMFMSINTLKLWLPQLFQTINDYEYLHGGYSSSMCEMLENTITESANNSTSCSVNLDNSSVYVKSIIVGCTSILSFFLAGTLISFLGKKRLIVSMAVIGGACATCIYFAQNADTVLALSSIFLALTGVCGNVLVTITLEMFPTFLRAMALSLHLTFSRIGSIVGNMVFPYLLYIGCAPPFFYIGSLTFDLKVASFEDAIRATEFGKFNIFLMLVTILPCFSQTFETTGMSYVVPVAQCDLNLTLEDKGALNAMIFAGMITSGFCWGYLSDTLGRKRIILYGYFLNAAVGILGSLAPNVTLLMLAKFFNGLLINGPFDAAASYLSEFHSSKYRAKVQLVRGTILSLANVIMPLLAWGILQRNLDFQIFNIIGKTINRSSLLSAVVYLFMPESPKFLMSAGRNEEALRVFQKVYRINTGNSTKTFPIRNLVEEAKNGTKKSTKKALLEGWHQIKYLFRIPYVLKLLLACTNCFMLMMSSNTLKLWLPQLFQAINDFKYNHNGESSNLCEMLEDLSPKKVSTSSCAVNLDNSSVYINSIIVGVSRIVAFLVAGPFVNLIGKKRLVIIVAIIGGAFSTSIYFAEDSETVLILSSMDIAFISLCENVLSTITLELFPTTLRQNCIAFFTYDEWTDRDNRCAGLCLLYPNTENKALATLLTANNDKQKGPSTFEDAVTVTGFGKFNILLLLITIPANFASVFETTTMSYIFSPAQCDLDLSLEDKGFLNSITYIGMISGAVIWGFLFDVLGRKKLLVCGFLLDGTFMMLSSFSQSIVPLIICKFLAGLIINGPFAAMSAYLSEFHCAKYRSKIQLTIGTVNTVGSMVLPLLAWAILPRSWDFHLFGGVYHSWNIYLLVCSIPAFYSGIVFLFLPESPKFLMTIGRNEKALKLFKKSLLSQYCIDIKELVDETTIASDSKYGGKVTANRSKIQALREGWQQISPLFHSPYLLQMVLVCVIQAGYVQSVNMIRLWLPQIFQAIEDYQLHHNGTTASLCTMLQQLTPKETVSGCTVNMDNASVYSNSLIVATVSLCCYLVAGFVINMAGKKKILIILGTVSSVACSCLYFSQATTVTIALSSVYIGLMSICVNVVLSVVVAIFPTTLRTLALSIAMMIARIGAVAGSLLFPVLLQTGCFETFFFVGGLVLCSALLCFILPDTENKDLK